MKKLNARDSRKSVSFVIYIMRNEKKLAELTWTTQHKQPEPEELIVEQQPADEEGEERHEEELGHEPDARPDRLPEHLPDDVQVELGPHVDGVDEDHEGQDEHEHVAERLVVNDDVHLAAGEQPAARPQGQVVVADDLAVQVEALGKGPPDVLVGKVEGGVEHGHSPRAGVGQVGCHDGPVAPRQPVAVAGVEAEPDLGRQAAVHGYLFEALELDSDRPGGAGGRRGGGRQEGGDGGGEAGRRPTHAAAAKQGGERRKRRKKRKKKKGGKGGEEGCK